MKFEKALELAKGGLKVYKEKYPDLTEQIDFQETIIKSLEMSVQKEKEDG